MTPGAGRTTEPGCLPANGPRSSRYPRWVDPEDISLADLFDQQEPLRLDAPDAELEYWPLLDIGMGQGQCLRELIEKIPWRAERITLFGRSVPQPRLTAWFGDPDTGYSYSGLQLQPLPWTPLLLALKGAVERAAGCSFNSVLLNYYRDHRDSMGMHADDEPELGESPVIASLSLGETRTLLLRHRWRRDVDPIRLPLASGSLLLMRGATQRNWKHGIGKLALPCGPRTNLTFRRILKVRPEKG